MTVAELIEMLKAAPQDAIVASEGCDCTQNANGICIFDFSWEPAQTVVIARYADIVAPSDKAAEEERKLEAARKERAELVDIEDRLAPYKDKLP